MELEFETAIRSFQAPHTIKPNVKESVLLGRVDPDYQEEIELVPENVNRKDYFFRSQGILCHYSSYHHFQ